MDELKVVPVDVEAWRTKVNAERHFHLPEGYNYTQRAALCLAILDQIRSSSNYYEVTQMISSISLSTHIRDHVDLFTNIILRPFNSYIDTRIDSGNMPLYMMRRFKHKVEWFLADKLLKLYENDTAHGESKLDGRLREFLFDQGVDYPFSTPLSSSGRTDILANLDRDDYFVIEVKIFNATQYGRGYIRTGFIQAVNYTQDYNKDVGFLVIFNVSSKKIEFDFERNTNFLVANNKTIFFVVINLKNPDLPASKQKKLDTYQIKEDFLKENKLP